MTVFYTFIMPQLFYTIFFSPCFALNEKIYMELKYQANGKHESHLFSKWNCVPRSKQGKSFNSLENIHLCQKHFSPTQWSIFSLFPKNAQMVDPASDAFSLIGIDRVILQSQPSVREYCRQKIYILSIIVELSIIIMEIRSWQPFICEIAIKPRHCEQVAKRKNAVLKMRVEWVKRKKKKKNDDYGVCLSIVIAWHHHNHYIGHVCKHRFFIVSLQLLSNEAAFNTYSIQ